MEKKKIVKTITNYLPDDKFKKHIKVRKVSRIFKAKKNSKRYKFKKYRKLNVS
jgi:hypothetical protein